jgi:hypothetical protein
MDKHLRVMTDLIMPLRVAPGSEVRLSRHHDPGYTGGVARPQAAALLADGVDLLAAYQDRLAAQDRFGVPKLVARDRAAESSHRAGNLTNGCRPFLRPCRGARS